MSVHAPAKSACPLLPSQNRCKKAHVLITCYRWFDYFWTLCVGVETPTYKLTVTLSHPVGRLLSGCAVALAFKLRFIVQCRAVRFCLRKTVTLSHPVGRLLSGCAVALAFKLRFTLAYALLLWCSGLCPCAPTSPIDS